MISRLISISCFLLICGTNLFAQQINLKGQVVLKGVNLPADGIHVYLDNTHFGTYSDQDGAFQFENVPAGKYELVASAIGYTTIRLRIVVETEDFVLPQLEVEETVMGLPLAVVQSVSLTGGLRGLRDVPGSAHFLAPQELQKFSFTDINRVLRAVPGVNLQEEDGFGLRPNIGLRGAGAERSSKITLMEDGILAAPAPYSAPAAYYFPTVGRMQAIEILKGSSQIRFGPYTTGGAINLISTVIPDDFSGRLDLLAGSFGSRSMHAYAGNSHRHFGYLIETFQYQSNGFKKLDGGGDSGFDKKDYLVKLQFQTGPRAKMAQSFLVKVGQSNEDSDETYLGLTAVDFEKAPFRRYSASQKDQMEASQHQYSLRHTIQISRSIDIISTVYRHDFHRNWYKLDKVKAPTGESLGIGVLLANPELYSGAYGILGGTTSLEEDALQVKANNRTYRALGAQTIASLRFGSGPVRHLLDIGLRYHFDEMDRFQWVDGYRMVNGVMELAQPGTPGTESNRILSSNAFAAYVQYKIKTGNWTFIPGIRFEDMALRDEDFGRVDPNREGLNKRENLNRIKVLIPGVGVNFQLNGSIDIFGGIHKGFSPPGAIAGTDPEQSINYELGIRVQGSNFSGQAVLFYNNYSNLLGADLAAAGGSGTGDLFNGGSARVGGMELECGYELFSRKQLGWIMPVRIAYTLTQATFHSSFESEFEGWGVVDAGDELPYLAHHQLALSFGLESRRWGLNGSGRLQSAMRTTAGFGPILEEDRADAFFIMDIAGYYQMHPNFRLFIALNNLFDYAYIVSRHPAGLRPAMPRNFLVGGKVQF